MSFASSLSFFVNIRLLFVWEEEQSQETERTQCQALKLVTCDVGNVQAFGRCFYCAGFLFDAGHKELNEALSLGSNFAFKIASDFHGIDFTRRCSKLFEFLLHPDMNALNNFCRFVSCTFMLPIFRSTTSQRISTGFRSGDWGGH